MGKKYVVPTLRNAMGENSILLMEQNKYFVVSGLGDSGSPASCWDCKLVKEFFTKSDAVRFAEKHYDYLVDQILTTCNAHWYKSIFVEVVGASKVSKLVKGVK